MSRSLEAGVKYVRLGMAVTMGYVVSSTSYVQLHIIPPCLELVHSWTAPSAQRARCALQSWFLEAALCKQIIELENILVEACEVRRAEDEMHLDST